MKKSKKILVFLLGIFSIVAVTVGLTLAWFTSQDNATNIATMGDLAVQLDESSTEPDAVVSDTGITYTDPRMPGDDVSKVVTAENTGDQDVYIRYTVTKSWNDPSTGNEVTGTDPAFIELLNITAADYIIVPVDANTTYYYLIAPLASGDTNTLFDSFRIADLTTNVHIGLEATIDVTTDAVQYTNGIDAVLAQGWDVHVDPTTLDLVAN